MKAIEAIKNTLDSSSMILNTYLGDFSDADLLVRPVPNANHTAWQIGHFLASEFEMMEAVRPGVSPKLPAGFAEKHSKETTSLNDASKFYKKSEYLNFFKAQRVATAQILESLSESDLDKPSPEAFQGWAPTLGSMINGTAVHLLMHVGQIAITRRALNKPIVI